MEINESEEYLGILRKKQASVQTRLREADDQVGVVRNALRAQGVQGFSSCDDEDSSAESTEVSLSDILIPPSSSYRSCRDNSDTMAYSDSFDEYSNASDNGSPALPHVTKSHPQTTA